MFSIRNLALGLTAVLALGGLAGIHAGDFDALHDREMIDRLLDHIGATGSVRDELLDLHGEFVAEQERLGDRKVLAHQSLADVLHAEVFDERAIRDAAAGLAEIQADEYVAHGRMMQRVRELLTPEQFEKLAEAHGGLHEHREHREHGGHGGHGHGAHPRHP